MAFKVVKPTQQGRFFLNLRIVNHHTVKMQKSAYPRKILIYDNRIFCSPDALSRGPSPQVLVPAINLKTTVKSLTTLILIISETTTN
jgi:hypothetical protein